MDDDKGDICGMIQKEQHSHQRILLFLSWLRRPDSNRRPLGYYIDTTYLTINQVCEKVKKAIDL